MAEVKMTEEQFTNAIKAAAEAGAKAALASAPAPFMSPSRDAETGVIRDPEELLRAIRTRKAPIPNRYVPCRTQQGSTFIAEIAYSRTFPSGRVLDIIDYRFPEGAERNEPTPEEIDRLNGVPPENAGLVPTGVAIGSAAHKEFKRAWITADRIAYASGTRFQEHIRSGPDVPTPEHQLSPLEREARDLEGQKKAEANRNKS